jgi:hypothetical protein
MQDLEQPTVSDTTLQRLKNCLMSAEALNFKSMCQKLDMPKSLLVEALIKLIKDHQVEVLRPVSLQASEPVTLHPLEHFRLIRPADTAFRWQMEIPRYITPTLTARRSQSDFWALALENA